MKNSAKIFRAGLIASALLFSHFSAISAIEGLDDNSPLAVNAGLISAEIGISSVQYLESVAKFRQLSQTRVQDQPLPINERPIFALLRPALTSKNPLTQEQKEKLLLLHNQVQSDFATYLGLTVPQYEKFLEVMNALDFYGQYRGLNLVGESADRKREIIQNSVHEEIEVLCDDDCQAALSSNNTISTRITIYGTAANAGIRQTVNMVSYNPFRVRFVDISGATITTQTWVYNDMSGAWRDYSGGSGQHPSF